MTENTAINLAHELDLIMCHIRSKFSSGHDAVNSDELLPDGREINFVGRALITSNNPEYENLDTGALDALTCMLRIWGSGYETVLADEDFADNEETLREAVMKYVPIALRTR